LHHRVQTITTSETSSPPKHHHFQNITTFKTSPRQRLQTPTRHQKTSYYVNSLFLSAANTANAAAAACAGAGKDCVALQTTSG